MKFETTENSKTDENDKSSEPDKFGGADIVDWVREHYELARTPEGLHIAIPTGPREPRVAKEVNALAPIIRRDLVDARRITPGRDVMSGALETVNGFAEIAPERKTGLRALEREASVYLDLGQREGMYVEASSYGWEVVDLFGDDEPITDDTYAPVFRRTAAVRELPEPVAGGSRDELRELLMLEANDPRWRLIWGWLVAAVFEMTPRPILWATGAQGSGKSTRARMALSVLDPRDALGTQPGRNERDDTTSARARFIPSWDNIGTVSAAVSDWLCRLVTGVEVDRRALYSDDEVRIGMLRRTGIATSITLPTGLRPDALERLVLVEFGRMPTSERETEKDLWRRFYAAHGRILGALLDDVVGVLQRRAEVEDEDPTLARMADYHRILYALDKHAGTEGAGGFAETYAESVQAAMADRAESDPLTAGLVRIVDKANGRWEGSASSLLTALSPDMPDDPKAPWPRTPRGLSAALTQASETLRSVGLVAESVKSNGKRKVVLSRVVDDAEAGTVTDPTVPVGGTVEVRPSLSEGAEVPRLLAGAAV